MPRLKIIGGRIILNFIPTCLRNFLFRLCLPSIFAVVAWWLIHACFNLTSPLSVFLNIEGTLLLAFSILFPPVPKGWRWWLYDSMNYGSTPSFSYVNFYLGLGLLITGITIGAIGVNTLTWQVVTGISSIFIAVCALFISVWHGIVARKHNRLSVRPHLTSWTDDHLNTKGLFRYRVMNNGLGPALIEKIVLKVDGNEVIGEGDELIKNALEILLPGRIYTYHSYYAFFKKGYSMLPKENVVVAEVQFNPIFPNPKKFGERLEKQATLEITYKSFYGERFFFPEEEKEVKK